MSLWWIQFLSLILAPTVAVVCVAFLCRSVIRQFLDRNLEAHRKALSAASEREVEKLKDDLRQAAHEHDVAFNILHPDRVNAVKLLYGLVRSFSKAAKRYAGREGVANADGWEASRKAVEAAGNDLSQPLFDNRIFLSEKVCVIIQRHLKEVSHGATLIAGEWFPPFRAPEEQMAVTLENKSQVEDSAGRLEEEITAEFRKILGLK